ncbi:MAG: hypothetical protein RJA36_449 [Pseudomonadota bacterium]|jgi:drug/metabolite transporter (DMT)-like permease
MNVTAFARLILLSAIWGGSFLFMRIAVPSFGPVPLVLARVGLAALFLAAVAASLRKPLQARRHWRHYLLLGCFNSALPFLLFAFAARTASASLLSLLNATAPIWSALIGSAWTRHWPEPRVAAGLALGVAGVALLAGIEALNLPAGGGLAIVAGLGAACCYGIATQYAKSAPAVEPHANAHGSMWAATLLLLPVTASAPLPAMPSASVLFAVLALGVACSGVAYLLYFGLIADLGATAALTVTYLVPVFGILWGRVFLGETVGWHTLAGGAIVLAGTALVTGVRPAPLLGGRRRA